MNQNEGTERADSMRYESEEGEMRERGWGAEKQARIRHS